jgi:hypothetical protein
MAESCPHGGPFSFLKQKPLIKACGNVIISAFQLDKSPGKVPTGMVIVETHKWSFMLYCFVCRLISQVYA